MVSLRKPSAEVTRRFLAAQEKLNFTYSAVGATAGELPAGYFGSQTRVKVGVGADAFQAARRAFEGWKHFDLGWTEAWPADTPIREGQVVAVMARAIGLWWLNAARIVYVVDETGPVCRFGFAYGTLPDHVETGEERFMVEWNRADDSVWYDIRAFSRPHKHLVRLAAPLARRIQRRFARESAAAMLRAVRAG